MNGMTDTDILIVGGGLAGLSAAARFARMGLQVHLVDPAPRDLPTGQVDQRSTAILQPGITTLDRAGIWPALSEIGTELEGLRIIEAEPPGTDPVETEFTASEAPGGRFGVNLPNGPFRTALIEQLEQDDLVTLSFRSHVTGMLADDHQARIEIEDQDGTSTTLSAQLIIAADGRDSSLREQAGIGHRRWSFDQDAVVLTVRHDVSHRNVSTEIHANGGPLTFVPVAGDGTDQLSAIVWMRPADRAEELMRLSDEALIAELQAESLGLFGQISDPSSRASWPMIGQIAHKLHAPRLALIAETAHVIPPIGAQGLNMSLDDIETLAGLIETAQAQGKDIAAPSLLRKYSLCQLPKTALRIGSVDGLNRIAKITSGPIPHIRRAGVSLLDKLPPLRQLAMRTGLTGSPFGRIR
ncbi:MAG: FAD-dependent monooxygenase [Alphaproteobacteria bacterium]